MIEAQKNRIKLEPWVLCTFKINFSLVVSGSHHPGLSEGPSLFILFQQ